MKPQGCWRSPACESLSVFDKNGKKDELLCKLPCQKRAVVHLKDICVIYCRSHCCQSSVVVKMFLNLAVRGTDWQLIDVSDNTNWMTQRRQNVCHTCENICECSVSHTGHERFGIGMHDMVKKKKQKQIGIILTGITIVKWFTISGKDIFCIRIFIFAENNVEIVMMWHWSGSVPTKRVTLL